MKRSSFEYGVFLCKGPLNKVEVRYKAPCKRTQQLLGVVRQMFPVVDSGVQTVQQLLTNGGTCSVLREGYDP